jgi:hypothetical protein
MVNRCCSKTFRINILFSTNASVVILSGSRRMPTSRLHTTKPLIHAREEIIYLHYRDLLYPTSVLDSAERNSKNFFHCFESFKSESNTYVEMNRSWKVGPNSFTTMKSLWHKWCSSLPCRPSSSTKLQQMGILNLIQAYILFHSKARNKSNVWIKTRIILTIGLFFLNCCLVHFISLDTFCQYPASLRETFLITTE